MIYSRKYSRNFIPLKQDNPKYNLDFRPSIGRCVIEIKDNMGKLSLYTQGIKPKTTYTLELVGFEKGKVKNVSLGTFNVDAYGKAEFSKMFNPDNVLDTNNKIEDFNVVSVMVKTDDEISSALVGYIGNEIDWQESYKANFINRDNKCNCGIQQPEQEENKEEENKEEQEKTEKEKGLDEKEKGLDELEKGLDEKEKGLDEKEKSQKENENTNSANLDDYEQQINERLRGLLEKEIGLMEKEQGLLERERSLRQGNLPKEDEDMTKRELDLIEREQELVKREQELVKREQELVKREQDLVRKNPTSEREKGLIEKEKGMLQKDQGLIEREKGLIEKEKGLIELEKGLRESRKAQDEKENNNQKENETQKENNHDSFKKMLENLRKSMLNIQNMEQETPQEDISNDIEYIKTKNAKMTPFVDDDTNWYRISPFELSAISKDAIKYQDNLMVALAYKKYKHLMLGISQKDDKEEYFLAIPCRYEEDFNMKSFNNFVAVDSEVSIKGLKNGEYGYRIEQIN